MQITPMIWFCIIGVSTLIVMIPYYIISLPTKRKSPSEIFAEIGQSMIDEPFSVSNYYARIEKTSLGILYAQKPVDQTIILWWGLDGLRLNDDGSLEWISRKKPEPVKQEVSPSAMCQVINPIRTEMENVRPTFRMDGMQQATQAQIDALQMQNRIYQMQAAQQAWSASMMATLQSYVVPYPSYLYGGMGGGVVYYSPLTDCCCNAKLR